MDRGVWQVTVHGITKSQIRLKLLKTHARTITKINFAVKNLYRFQKHVCMTYFLQYVAQNMCA